MASAGLAAVSEAAKLMLHTAAKHNGRRVTGVVVSAGLASKTAKVRVGGEEWNKKVQKFFKKPEKHLVHDPNDSLRTGDIVEILSGWRTSKHKRHVVTRIIAPFGPPIDERPPVPTAEEREREHALYTKAKKERKFLKSETEQLITKMRKAEKITEEITKTAVTMKLVKDVQWVATPLTTTKSATTTPGEEGPKVKKTAQAKARAKRLAAKEAKRVEKQGK